MLLLLRSVGAYTNTQTLTYPYMSLSVSCDVSDFALMFSIERGWCVCLERRKKGSEKGKFQHSISVCA